MKSTLILVAVLLFALQGVANDLGRSAPVKRSTTTTPPPADPAILRQGGDTILDAVVVAIPYHGSGTTAGFVDDYDEACPYTMSTSPDVVYSVTPANDSAIVIDLYGSDYDTKVYVYDENLVLVACNDDFYSDYTSKLEYVGLLAGVQYFLVIDGYGADFGNYQLSIDWWYHGCAVICPPAGVPEGEPPLVIDYVDDWNGGCDTDLETGPFQAITDPIFCGVSGWYLHQGSECRDTDWFTYRIPAGGVLEVTCWVEYAIDIVELGPQECGGVGVIQSVSIGSCCEGTMTIAGDAGATVWFWVGPQAFSSPLGLDVQEFNYGLISNLEPVAAVARSWSGIKGLFR